MSTEIDSAMSAKESIDKRRSSLSVVQKLKNEGKQLAKDLHNAGDVYVWYALLDGMSLSYSMIKYVFDMLCTNTDTLSTDAMHDWMMTPQGVAAITSESFFIITFSYFGNICKSDEKSQWKKFLALSWPYCRDSMKGLKNAYKGIRSTFQIAEALGIANTHQMIVPVGLLLGVFSALNRMWMRKMISERKKMMTENDNLLEEVKAKSQISSDEITNIMGRIRSQSNYLRNKGLTGAAYGGIVDGMYLYMGVVTISVFAPHVYLALSICSMLFTVGCIATRMYEEHDFQKQLVVTQERIKLAIIGKEIQTLVLQAKSIGEEIEGLTQIKDEVVLNAESLLFEQSLISNRVLDIERLSRAYAQLGTFLDIKCDEFEKQKSKLRSTMALSYTEAALAGIRSGLGAYSAISSALFAIVTINTMLLMPISPGLVIGTVALGAASVVVFLAHALIVNYYHHKAQAKAGNKIQTLAEFIADVKSKKEQVAALKNEKIEKIIRIGWATDPSPQFYFLEVFEIVRSFFSGVAKGQKSVDYTLNPLQEPDEKGHYHDTNIMLMLTMLSSFFYAIGLALRALAKGFGRESLIKNNQEELDDVIEEAEQLIEDEEPPSPPKGPSGSPGPNLRTCSSEPRIALLDPTLGTVSAGVSPSSQFGKNASSPTFFLKARRVSEGDASAVERFKNKSGGLSPILEDKLSSPSSRPDTQMERRVEAPRFFSPPPARRPPDSLPRRHSESDLSSPLFNFGIVRDLA
ncbi:transmembrane protein (plasmid) [Legionella adelaidensis]|uniref:Transmembrane protein n=1 Tax=Legionella adelaidensis TaxID=45056 RepID=A0A0W0R0Z6_9GAMM|nr:hypothetical protein [Legionella adelaidensis]KTC64769.1 transmembrane protein [Legionella adelaidensis]VEH81351.1 transmembrane protein [Legionella adelaidensis]